MFDFRYINDEPIIDVKKDLRLNGNANGPSLIKIPTWVKKPIAKYYLYFAHHKGKSIRLALADSLTRPWRLSEISALELKDSLFAINPPRDCDLDEGVKHDIAKGDDGNYPHIASPDVVIDEARQQIRLYYHGRLADGTQATRVAISEDGINFIAQPEILGLPYFRVFKYQDYYYAMAMPGVLYRSLNGLDNFETGAMATSFSIRHFAFLQHDDKWFVFSTRVGDAPERILCSALLTNGDWHNWKLGPETEIHRPEKNWEGANLPCLPSKYGAVMNAVNQLRDPAIYCEKENIYLLYSVAGEQGIAIGELTPAACD